jgi:hypothetical protein
MHVCVWLIIFFNSHSGGGFQTGSTPHVGHFWPIIPAPGDCEDGEFGGIKIGRGNRSTRRIPAPAPLCPPQIPLDQTRARTLAAAVGSQRLTSWAMARPYVWLCVRLGLSEQFCNWNSPERLICRSTKKKCSLCRLIGRTEHLIGRHWYLPANWRSFFRWSSEQWVSQCYATECDRSFYCALFCVFMTRVSQCPTSQRAEHPLYRVFHDFRT